jgi:hypothetical protein
MKEEIKMSVSKLIKCTVSSNVCTQNTKKEKEFEAIVNEALHNGWNFKSAGIITIINGDTLVIYVSLTKVA